MKTFPFCFLSLTNLKEKFVVFLIVSSVFLGTANNVYGQLFPNAATLSTGQGTAGTNDPLWLCSPWSSTHPGNPMGLTFGPTLINNNCAPGSWVNPTTLPAPVNNGNWITGTESNCATNTTAGYRFFRLPLNLPADCNGYSVTVAGNYVLDLMGYVDNSIIDVFINGNSQGISGGSYAAGSQLNIHLIGPWVAGLNYVDVLVYNTPSAGGGSNPYGLLMVANTSSTSGNDTDQDGVNDLDDLCPCEAGDNAFGCLDPVANTCDIAAIRAAFTNVGCIELPTCVQDCSIYFVNPQAMTGSQAQAFAQNLGANLVSIQSQAENDCILDALAAVNQTGTIWIGLTDEVTEGTFLWYDQSPVTYTNWNAGEPNQSGNEDCVQIFPTGANAGKWNDLSCTSSNAKSIIEVNLCPVVNTGQDRAICIGNSTSLTPSLPILGSSPYTYDWNNGVTTINQTVAPTLTNDYILTVKDRYNCSVKDTVKVIVNALPLVDAGQDISVCPQETVTLSGNGAATYTWNNGISNGVAFTPAESVVEYVVTGTDSNNCVNTDTVSVSVILNGCPNFPNNFTCDIDSIRSTFEGLGCIEMVGCVSECSMYFLNPQSLSGDDAQAFAQLYGTNLVSIQSQAENDCILSSLVNLGLSTTNDVIWIGFNDQAIEGSFVWYDQSPVVYTNWATGEPNNSGNNENCVQIYPDGSWNDLNCGTANAKSIIEVNLCPVLNAGTDKIICLGESTVIESTATILGSNPYTYQWTNGATSLSTTVQPTQTTNFTIVTTDRYSCTTSDTVMVTVNPLPEVGFDANTVCFGEVTAFNNLSNGPGSVFTSNWDLGNGTNVQQTNPLITYSTPGSKTVKLVVENSFGCKDSLTKTINVFGIPPMPNLYNSSPVQCPDDEAVLSIENVNGATYFWLGPNGFSSNDKDLKFNVSYEKTGEYVAYVTVNGCISDTAVTLVQILGSYNPYTDEFPNVITPNGDGVNDELDIDQFFNACLPYELVLYNRWGNKVYDQSLGTKAFSGKDKGGADLSAGTYFYQLKYGDKLETGFITIVR